MYSASDSPTPFHDLRLVANGGVIVEGRLRFVVDGPTGARLEPPQEVDLVVDCSNGVTRRSFSLMPKLTQDPDGFRDWRRPILTFELFGGLLDHNQTRLYPRGPIAVEASTAPGRLAQVTARYPASGGFDAPMLFANVSRIRANATPGAAGLRLEIEGHADPTQGNERVPPLEAGRIDCDVLIPWTYLKAVGDPLGDLEPSRSARDHKPFRPYGDGLARLALNGTMGLFEGELRLQGAGNLYPEGPFVRTSFYEHRIALQSAGELTFNADGFAWGRATSGGPELTVNLGHRNFTAMLGVGRSARLELRGAGIGQVDGQTGWVMESGGPCTQQMTSCTVDLERSNEGLRIVLAGELASLPGGHWARSLGPGFSSQISVPNAFMLLRRWDLPQLIQERRARFGLTFS